MLSRAIFKIPMDDKDTFWGMSYRQGHIHGCHNRTKGCEEIKVQFGGKTWPVKSLHAAKIAITRAMRESR